MKKTLVIIAVCSVFALNSYIFAESGNNKSSMPAMPAVKANAALNTQNNPDKPQEKIDPMTSIIKAKPELTTVEKYKIPPEGSLEWIAEEAKAQKTGVAWNNFLDDFLISRPGDSYSDLRNGFDFEAGLACSALGFIYFYTKDGLVTEDKLKSFGIATGLILLKEALTSTTMPNNHFCAKEIAAGVAGALLGSFIMTINF